MMPLMGIISIKADVIGNVPITADNVQYQAKQPSIKKSMLL